MLSTADPGSGTFSLEERALLSAFAGRQLTLSHEELLGVQFEAPSLAYALAPTEEPAFAGNDATPGALAAQMGAALATFSHPDEQKTARARSLLLISLQGLMEQAE